MNSNKYTALASYSNYEYQNSTSATYLNPSKSFLTFPSLNIDLILHFHYKQEE